MEENDKLKKYVKQHRSKMDLVSPPAFNLKKHVPKKPEMVRLSSVLKVAVIALGIVIAGGIYLTSNQVNYSIVELSDTEEEQRIKEISLAMISDDLGEMEVYYTKQINETYLEIEEEGMIEEVTEQLRILDEEFIDLQNELNSGVDMEFVINEMIDNYRMKLKLLEHILKKINQQKGNNTKENYNEKYIVYT